MELEEIIDGDSDLLLKLTEGIEANPEKSILDLLDGMGEAGERYSDLISSQEDGDSEGASLQSSILLDDFYVALEKNDIEGSEQIAA